MHAHKTRLLAGLTLGVGLGACATAQPPATLVEARSTYQAAQTGRAGEVAPAELYLAQKELTLAETSFKEDGASWDTNAHAYLALRNAERAQIIAEDRDELAKTTRREENKDALSDQMRRDATKKLGDAKQELGDAKDKLQDEKMKRADADAARVKAEVDAASARQKLKDMTDRLKLIGQVNENERGLVIALSAGVIFSSGSSTLLAPAFPKLDQVAEFLKQTGLERKVLIEGHTDSAGPDASNLLLSTARAESVRSYLVTRGVDAARVSAIGMGESKPVATNNTAEGRANNRRVEIVLAPLPVPSATP
ncbi:MAG: OmpA family protein [Myxococcota bacterium]